MTLNFNENFSVCEESFPRIFLKNVFTVSFQHFMLSIPDYGHGNSQRFSHVSIIVPVPIFNWERFGVYSVLTAVTFLCVFGCSRRWLVTFYVFLLVLYWSNDDLIIHDDDLIIMYTDLYEYFDWYIP